MQHGGDVPWHAALGAGKNRVSRIAGAGGIRRRVSSSDYPSDVMLEAARASNAYAIKKGTVRMLRGTVERIPYEEFFDKAFARNSFHTVARSAGRAVGDSASPETRRHAGALL